MKDELIQYRLQQAQESLHEADLLLKAGHSYRGSVNRSYYAMFYSVLALLVKSGKSTSKHGGVISMFDEQFVKRGIFAKEMSKALHKAFDLRQMGDYRELAEIEAKDAEECLKQAKAFFKEVKKYLA